MDYLNNTRNEVVNIVILCYAVLVLYSCTQNSIQDSEHQWHWESKTKFHLPGISISTYINLILKHTDDLDDTDDTDRPYLDSDCLLAGGVEE